MIILGNQYIEIYRWDFFYTSYNLKLVFFLKRNYYLGRSIYFVSTKYCFTFFYTHYSINIFTIDAKMYKFEKSKKKFTFKNIVDLEKKKERKKEKEKEANMKRQI